MGGAYSFKSGAALSFSTVAYIYIQSSRYFGWPSPLFGGQLIYLILEVSRATLKKTTLKKILGDLDRCFRWFC